MSNQSNKFNDDKTDSGSHRRTGSLGRRDVMKAASGAIVADAVLTEVGRAQTTFCGKDGCTAVTKPSKDVYTLTDDRACVEFDQAYLDARLDEGFDTLGIKSGSCTNHDDGNKDCDYVSLDAGTYSYCVPATCNDISHPELLDCQDCTYADDTYAVDTENATCERVPVSVQSADPNCPVTAVLHVAGPECPSATLEQQFTSEGSYTFEVPDCCAPQKVVFTDGSDALTTIDLPLSNCGYDDLSVSDIQFCCDTVTFEVSGVECEVIATLDLAHGDCRRQIETLLSDDGPVRFDWPGCFTPQSIILKRKGDGTTITTLTPTKPLTCACPADARTACTFSGKELPAKDDTNEFECQGVTFEVTTTHETDGKPSCFKITNLSDQILRVDVIGEGTTTYSFGDCGTWWTGELCANAVGESDTATAIESWTVYVCKQDIGGCVGGSAD